MSDPILNLHHLHGHHGSSEIYTLTMERVQEKALRQITGLKGNTYEERCKELNLETIERRRYVQDKAQVLTIIKHIDKLPAETLFQPMDKEQGQEGVETLSVSREKFTRTTTSHNVY